MAIPDLHAFLRTFFTLHNCPIVRDESGLLSIQLTEEMDKALMNRPFYWHYMEKIGQTGTPMQLTLITNPEKRDEKGEWIHFGSPRLHQILNHLKEREKFIHLFEKVDVNTQTPLYPWLLANVKVSYIGRQKKDMLYSVGLQLINGSMRFSMMDYLDNIPLQKTIPDYCYTISPIIRLKSGFGRIEKVIYEQIAKEQHGWAVESLRTLKEEEEMIRHFYKDEEEQERMNKELEALRERYQPVIEIKIVNGGLIYLTK
ncbi:hypothetical protein GCM10010978_18930 [Compostibacillus humi]|uniref:YqhG family protein n=1 Tax=Compostibacillus humi TaxID=1245525 RepID=A0A8J2XF56_9BACI|nr:YqhG family protein [Compostibacillus humi]GFZ77620.1 hypothetical protein GCM10010978_18930 [Compostibacillus humi]